jgi:uncharacterized protein YraI
MIHRMLQTRLTLWGILLIALLLIVSLTITTAQDTIVIETGTAAVGTIVSDGSPVTYAFNGSVGDVVTIRAIGLTAGTDPNITLFGPTQQQLAFNDNETFMPFGTASEITFRLQETGTHFVVVSGTTGDFVLTVSVRPPVTAANLQLDTPVNVTFPVADPSQVFVFNTDPALATSVLIDVTSSDVNARVEVRNATGTAIASLQGDLDNVCLTFAPGDELHEVTIVSAQETSGTMTITLSNAPCELGEVSAEVTPLPIVQFVPVPIEGVCAASSPRNVNIRSGPGLGFSVIALLPANQPIQVIGQNEGGTWYAVQNSFLQGWISAGVVGLAGPCDGLVVVPVPAEPVASATPGLPVFTATPMATTTATATGEATDETTPEVTDEATEEPTGEGTLTETPTATSTP